jgi:tetratricopeptide (TPR) repeat protein
MGDYLSERKSVEDSLRSAKADERCELLTKSAKLNFLLGEYQNAKADIDLALQCEPHNAETNSTAGTIALAEYFFTKAKGYFIVAPDAPNSLLGLIALDIRLRDISKARQNLERLRHVISSSNAIYSLFELYINVLEGKGSDEAILRTELVKNLPDDPYTRSLLAELFVTSGEYDAALSTIEKTLVYAKSFDHLYAVRAYANFAKQLYQDADADAMRAVSINPHNALALTIQAKVQARRGRYEEAEQIAKKILRQSPEYVLAHANLGDIHFSRGRYAQALESYKRSEVLMKTNTKGSQLRHARIAFIEGDYAKARVILEPLVVLPNSFYDDAICDLILVYDALGLNEARSTLQDRLEMRKKYSHRVDALWQKIATSF